MARALFGLIVSIVFVLMLIAATHIPIIEIDNATGLATHNQIELSGVSTEYLSGTGVFSTPAGGSGDSITVNSSAATNPDFTNGDIDWTLSGGNIITATVGCSGCVDVTDLASSSVDTAELVDDSVDPADLDFTSAPGAGQDELCVTYEHATTNFELQSCGSGGVSDGDKGDITVSSGGTNWQLDGDVVGNAEIADDVIATNHLQNASVTFPKLDILATQRVIGRNTAGTGTPEAVSATQLLDWIGSSFGALLKRDVGSWVALAPGSDGQVLTVNGGEPLWESPIRSGLTTVDFGSFPGSADAQVTVSGQTGINTGTGVNVYVNAGLASVDHTTDEHAVLDIRCVAKDVVVNTSFVIHCFYTPPDIVADYRQNGTTPPRTIGPGSNRPESNKGASVPIDTSNATRVHGVFNVGWHWFQAF